MTHLITNSSVTVFSNYRPYTADKTHPNFTQIINKLRADTFHPSDISLFDLSREVPTVIGNLVISRNGVEFVNPNTDVRTKIHGTIADRILENWQNGFEIFGLANFLGKLLKNPYKVVIDNLYTYLEKYKLAIDDDGDIVGIKAINPDYTSIFKPSFRYFSNGIISEPLSELETNPLASTGRGLYFGFEQFVFGFGRPDSLVIAVKVNPAHIIGIPEDSGYQKMRAHTLNVLRSIGTVEKLRGHFKTNNNPAKVPEFAQWAKQETAKIKRDSKGRFTKGSVQKRDNKGRFVK
ncbi:MAG: hypothetical protein EKK57_00780 [Proteobacteria bacterium]|nr:MAG: hypothetical protein EKK57_00780 [Pseudomonadota bacterium]